MDQSSKVIDWKRRSDSHVTFIQRTGVYLYKVTDDARLRKELTAVGRCETELSTETVLRTLN
jgi:putative salt-induced outer membrane protein YdiY